MNNSNEMLSNSKVEKGNKESSAHSNRHLSPVLPATKLFGEVSSQSQVALDERSRATDLKSLAEDITQSLSGFKSLRLSMDRDMKRVIVRVVDQKTDNVVRQIPGERMTDLVKQMRDLEGLLVKATA
jgi:flagellar protein FlaG